MAIESHITLRIEFCFGDKFFSKLSPSVFSNKTAAKDFGSSRTHTTICKADLHFAQKQDSKTVDFSG
jgi:hypothetical protein